MTINDSGDLIVYLTDGNSVNAGNLIYLLTKYTESLAFKEQTANVGKLKPAANAITVRWEAVEDVDGYEIRYSTSKKMKNAEIVVVNNPEADSKKIKNLESNKTYYIQVRGFMALGSENVYTEWSDIQSADTAA